MLKGVVLAGGTGSRLMPLTTAINKHLLPVGNEPMIFHPVKKLAEADIREIMIVTGTEHAGQILQTLGSGKNFATPDGKRIALTYRVQDRAGGIAEALGLVEHFVASDPFCVILGDNIFSASLKGPAEVFVHNLDHYTDSPRFLSGKVMLKQVPDPQRYGVAVFNGAELISIVEKPAAPPSNLAVTGIYFYCGGEWLFDLIRDLAPSERGEVEITDLNLALLKMHRLDWGSLYGHWTDAGTHESLRRANELVPGTA